MSDLHSKDYLGDGVYVGTDGYHIVVWLDAPGAFGAGAVAMEPPVLRRLVAYAARMEKEHD